MLLGPFLDPTKKTKKKWVERWQAPATPLPLCVLCRPSKGSEASGGGSSTRALPHQPKGAQPSKSGRPERAKKKKRRHFEAL